MLNFDLQTLNEYFTKWRLRPKPNKTDVSTFHLNNKQSYHPLNVTVCGRSVTYNPNPKYLGVIRDRIPSDIAAKLKFWNNIIQKLKDTEWRADFSASKTFTITLLYSIFEYCTPSWINCTYTKKVNSQLNDITCIISETLITYSIATAAIQQWFAYTKANSPKWMEKMHTVFVHVNFMVLYFQVLYSRTPQWRSTIEFKIFDFSFEHAWRNDWSTSKSVQNYSVTRNILGHDIYRKQLLALTESKLAMADVTT